jgi:alkanesulfonate monooxygenase SsuD/methylene tetrahydromethanopterin reductase-like flavin-dependent oxidoreductase (luciferase family)
MLVGRRADRVPGADNLPVQLAELLAFFHGTVTRITAVPGAGNMPAIWLLGSSDFSARLAAELGIPFSFAHHFMPQNTEAALEIYRRNFKPSPTLGESYTKIGVAVVCAQTDDEARWLHGPAKLSFLRLRSGRPVHSPLTGGSGRL